MPMVSNFRMRDFSGCCSKCDGRGEVQSPVTGTGTACHWCEGTGGDPARNYTVFEWVEGLGTMARRPIVQTCKAYKADVLSTVRALERRGWTASWFHGTKAECVAEAKRRNAHQVRHLEREIEHMQGQITKLRKAAL